MQILFILFIIPFVTADLTHSKGGTSINVLGQSGKVKITRDNTEITLQVDYLYEVDASGNKVGKYGQNKHSVESFATQSFTFSPLTSKENLDEFTFETPVYSIGKLKLRTMLYNQSGTVGTETETWNVASGDIKFNIELSDWTFCNPCGDGTALYIDVGIEIKGKDSIPKGNKTIDLGGATLELSNRVVIDGSEINMPESYPQIETQGSKQLYVFRFPKFTNTVIYDPLLQLSAGHAYTFTWMYLVFLLLITI